MDFLMLHNMPDLAYKKVVCITKNKNVVSIIYMYAETFQTS